MTWSIAGAGIDISRFGISTQTSVSGNSFLSYNFTRVIADAFAEWSKYGDIEFRQVSDGGGAAGVGLNADIRIFFGEIPGSTAGFAFYPSSFGSAIAGDILLDTLGRFNSDPLLFASVVLHEIGHALGLGHVNGQSIMTPTVQKIGLQSDDIAGIQTIYGVQDDVLPPNPGPDVPDPNQDERLVGTGFANTIRGGDGDDTIIGRAGDDMLYGGQDDDRLEGGTGNDKQYGNYGADQLLGGSGMDSLYGGRGRDTLEGGNEDDVLRGGNQADMLDGGSGNDVMKGGLHSDLFVFRDDHGRDKISDFNARSDNEKIDLSAVTGFDSFSDVRAASTQVRKHVRIETDDDSSILLQNVQLSQLDAGDFIF